MVLSCGSSRKLTQYQYTFWFIRDIVHNLIKKQEILVREIASRNLVLAQGLKEAEGQLLVDFHLGFVQYIMPVQLQPTHTLLEVWVDAKDGAWPHRVLLLIWSCFRITANYNHKRENGNKFSFLLGQSSLVNLYLCLPNGPHATQQHCGNSPWEPVVTAEP